MTTLFPNNTLAKKSKIISKFQYLDSQKRYTPLLQITNIEILPLAALCCFDYIRGSVWNQWQGCFGATQEFIFFFCKFTRKIRKKNKSRNLMQKEII
jgi:hypothetical protein